MEGTSPLRSKQKNTREKLSEQILFFSERRRKKRKLKNRSKCSKKVALKAKPKNEKFHFAGRRRLHKGLSCRAVNQQKTKDDWLVFHRKAPRKLRLDIRAHVP
ncbi:hypothetical protein RUM44_001137 [Polyplax serrata]|uniref:Uncharacterized protein n=1 Tax=Polyplax serrata TaxID=468196 RepID=A0ABR1B6Q1_POLSC